MSSLSVFGVLFVIFVVGRGGFAWENLELDSFPSRNEDFTDLSLSGSYETRAKKHDMFLLCGKNLFSAIRLACAGRRKKRSTEYGYLDNDITNSPAYGRFRGSNLIKNFYKRGGASQECCDRPCSRDHLLTYC